MSAPSVRHVLFAILSAALLTAGFVAVPALGKAMAAYQEEHRSAVHCARQSPAPISIVVRM